MTTHSPTTPPKSQPGVHGLLAVLLTLGLTLVPGFASAGPTSDKPAQHTALDTAVGWS